MSPSAAPASLPHVPASAGTDAILEALYEAGGVIIEGLLTPEQVRSMNTELDGPLDALNPGSTHDSDLIKAFHGSNTKRLTGLPTYSKTFRDHLLDHDLCHDILERIFHPQTGTYWLSTAQVIQIGPGNAAQVLHRDQGQFQVFDRMGPSAPEAMMNFLVALTDFTDENGATRIIPGSHKWPDFAERGTPEDTIPAEMRAGDAALLLGKTVHGGGANRTQNEYRRAIAYAFQASFLTPEEAYAHTMPMELVKEMSLRAQRMIGFRSQYPTNSPGLWQFNYEEIGDHLGLRGREKVVEDLKAAAYKEKA
jgi:ectoine hydroxylase-related dioxygenase (phytanoyl-CoA dioxygenase family)